MSNKSLYQGYNYEVGCTKLSSERGIKNEREREGERERGPSIMWAVAGSEQPLASSSSSHSCRFMLDKQIGAENACIRWRQAHGCMYNKRKGNSLHFSVSKLNTKWLWNLRHNQRKADSQNHLNLLILHIQSPFFTVNIDVITCSVTKMQTALVIFKICHQRELSWVAN